MAGVESVDVNEARRVYIESPEPISLMALAKAFQGKKGCTLSSFQKRARPDAEGWLQQRKDFHAKVEKKARDRAATKQSYTKEQEIEDTLELMKEAKNRAQNADGKHDTFPANASAYIRLTEKLRRLTSDSPEGIHLTQDMLDKLLED